MITRGEILNLYAEQIRNRFQNARIDFGSNGASNPLELGVYVFDKSDFREIKAFCDKIKTLPEHGISIVVKMWTGPWPAGESESQLRHKREAFIRHAKEQSKKVVHHS